ncbi:MAG: hypothetical protein EOO04_15710 [Chitinophagaceae bacterium]|nr:MAG: hypothetical protein EOO04_15710 [Chitinophagaceae bacterium]
MKTIQKLLFLALIYQCAPAVSVAQAGIPLKSSTPEKTFLFSRFPQKFECSYATLEQVFDAEENQEVTIPLISGNSFKGTVIAKTRQDENVSTINILSSNYAGAMLSLSHIKQADGKAELIGRILNPRNSDVLVIQRSGDKYFVTKELAKFVMADCPLPENISDQSGRL